MPSAKRSLFQTPTRVTKRRRSPSKKSVSMRVPKSLLPETKNFIQDSLTNNSTSYAYSSVPSDMGQGDGGNQFIGQKFRMLRLRVNYDFTQLTITEAVRVSIVMPKDPSTIPTLTASLAQWDTSNFTVLHDLLLPDAAEVAAGTFDVTGPLNVEMNSSGTTPLRNNIYIYVHTAGLGATIRFNFGYQIWYTDS